MNENYLHMSSEANKTSPGIPRHLPVGSVVLLDLGFSTGLWGFRLFENLWDSILWVTLATSLTFQQAAQATTAWDWKINICIYGFAGFLFFFLIKWNKANFRISILLGSCRSFFPREENEGFPALPLSKRKWWFWPHPVMTTLTDLSGNQSWTRLGAQQAEWNQPLLSPGYQQLSWAHWGFPILGWAWEKTELFHAKLTIAQLTQQWSSRAGAVWI